MIFDEERYRLCGDQFISIYFGDEGIVEESFFTITVNQAIRNANIKGVIEVAATASSIFIRYDPFVSEGTELISKIKEITERIRATEGKFEINSNIITIPMLYNDRWTRECAKAHKVPPNIDIVTKFNGLNSTEEFIRIHSAATYWVRYVAGPGLIGLNPLFQERHLFAPKYERIRSWTPSRTFGLGGNCTGYYPFEMPGGIQLIGRLPIPLFDPTKSHPAFESSPSICKICDRVRFVSINEEEYTAIERNFTNYEYDVQIGVFEYGLGGDKDA